MRLHTLSRVLAFLTCLTGAPCASATAPQLRVEAPDGTSIATTSVISWGNIAWTPPAAQTDVLALAQGYSAILATVLKQDGSIISWDFANGVRMSIPEEADSGVRTISVNSTHIFALKFNGRVVSWNNEYYNYSTYFPVPGTARSGVAAIASGGTYSAVLKLNGEVFAWKHAATSASITPPEAARSGVIAIAAGLRHIVALKNDGRVIAWGETSIPLLNVAVPPRQPPQTPDDLYSDETLAAITDVPTAAQSGITAIAAGVSHSLALKNDGSVIAWGANRYGQTDVPETAISGVIAISAGPAHSVALKTDGSVIAWGHNYYGECDIPAAAQSGIIAISAGYFHTLALKKVHLPVSFGNQAVGTTSTPKTLTLKNTGTAPLTISRISTTGDAAADFLINTADTLTLIPAGGQTTLTVAFAPTGGNTRQTSVRIISDDNESPSFAIPLNGTGISAQEILITYADGTPLPTTTGVINWGDYHISSPTIVPLAAQSGVIAIDESEYTTYALKNDGSLYAWQGSADSESVIPAEAQSGVTAISVSYSHAAVLKTDGSVFTWYLPEPRVYSPLDPPRELPLVPQAAQSGVIATSAGYNHTVALKADGSVIAWGYDGIIPTPASSRSGITAISTGYQSTIALKNDGSVIAWSYSGERLPVPEALHSGVIAIEPGGLAIKNDGSLISWDLSNLNPPRLIAHSGISSAAAGNTHIVATKTDGSVIAWGPNNYGQTTIPAAAQSGVIALAAGGGHVAALKSSLLPLTFDRTPVGTTSTPKNLTLKNTGTAPLTISSISTTGDAAADFTLKFPSPLPLIPAGGQLSLTVTFTPHATGTRQTTLRILNNDDDEATFDIPLTGTGLTTLAAWRQQHFGPTANAHAGDGADTHDFDHDGLANLLEYAFALDPTDACSAILPTPQVIGDNIVITFTEPHGISEVIYSAEWSTTLLPDSWTTIPDTGHLPVHTFSIPRGDSPAKFLRLKITRP